MLASPGNSRFPRIDGATTGGLFAIVLWSTTFALARSLSEQVGPLTGAAAVYLTGYALSWAGPVCRTRRAPTRLSPQTTRLSARYTIGCGSLFVLYTALIYFAVGQARDRQQLLEIALVNYLWPAGTILLSIPLLGKRASWLLLPGTVVAVAGIFLVLTQAAPVSLASVWDHALRNPLAYGSALLAAITWALYSNLARRWSDDSAGGAVPLFVAASGLVLLALRFLLNEQSAWTAKAALEALALGAVTALGYGLWDLAMRKGDLLLVVSCSYFTPLLSTILSCIYLQVAPGGRLWLGCLLLVGGTLLSWRAIRHQD